MQKLQEKVTEVRRKLDDTQAALHELGRENQSLQVGRYLCTLKPLTVIPMRVHWRGFCLLGRIGPQYPLLILKSDKKGQCREKFYI